MSSAQTTAATDASATTAERPSKQEYLAAGDAICADLQVEAVGLRRQAQQLEAEAGRLPRAEFLTRAATFWREQIRVMEAFHASMAQLGAPPGDEERVRQLLASLEQGIVVAHEIEETLAGGDDVRPATVEEYGRAVARGNTLARAYGFEVCGRTE